MENKTCLKPPTSVFTHSNTKLDLPGAHSATMISPIDIVRLRGLRAGAEAKSQVRPDPVEWSARCTYSIYF